MTGLSFIQRLYSILSSDQELASIVSKRIYPLVAEEGTEFPYMIISKQNVQGGYNKDLWLYDIITFSVTIYAKDYKTTAKAAERVREILEKAFKFPALLESCSEDFASDTYYQTLSFTVRWRETN